MRVLDWRAAQEAAPEENWIQTVSRKKAFTPFCLASTRNALPPDRMIVHLQKSCLLGGSLFVNDSGRKWEEFHGFDNIQLSLPIT